MRTTILTTAAAACVLWGLAATARAAEPHPNGVVGTSFPADFPRIVDASLGVPVLGFGGS
jgi:hypothetical protein